MQDLMQDVFREQQMLGQLVQVGVITKKSNVYGFFTGTVNGSINTHQVEEWMCVNCENVNGIDYTHCGICRKERKKQKAVIEIVKSIQSIRNQAVCIIKAPPSAVSRLIMDPRERGNWDPHFSNAEEVDSCFPRTQIVRLKGRLAWRRSSGSPL